MAKSLVIVESPAKAKTISKILGKGFQVKASSGHIRDLPKKKLGVSVRKKFEPTYEIMPDKQKIVDELHAAAVGCEHIYLAPDPDREGEAIAWHLAFVLQDLGIDTKRIEFNEITKDAIKKAMKKPREIDEEKENAQQARRVLDRLVGYKISPLLWQKVKRGLSAGRVQSVAVRLICDRETDIEAFKPQEYWTVDVELSKDNKNKFTAELQKYEGKKPDLGNEKKVKKILETIEKENFVVKNINVTEQKRTPAQPFTTSTLQQDASRKFGFTVKRTMTIAQQLYEGIEIGNEGPIGLITYMRTDSTRVSKEALVAVRDHIKENYGEEFLPHEARKAKVKTGAQDAHEAIRPTDLSRTPKEMKALLKPDFYKLYKLIWDRFVASQMENSIMEILTIDIEAGKSIWRAKANKIKFQGFLILYHESKEENDEDEETGKLPVMEKGEKLKKHKVEPKQHFTQPPPRYNEASLVKILEEEGIGRPSTYAPTISTVQSRGYVLRENKALIPTELGRQVNEQLVLHFPSIVDVKFTAEMETTLDKIESGKREWHQVLQEFYDPFAATLKVAKVEMQPVPIISGEMCELCGKNLLIKSGRFGDFLACEGYPECKNTKPIIKKIGLKCFNEGCDGDIIQKISRKGKVFYGCSNYPNCNFTAWDEPVNKPCPDCKKPYMVKKLSKKRIPFLLCTNQECKKMLNMSSMKTKENKDQDDVETDSSKKDNVKV
jgi:DNA topoisomerase-1